MESINFIFTYNNTEVTPHEDKDSDLTSHNIDQGVADNIKNNMQSAEEDGD